MSTSNKNDKERKKFTTLLPKNIIKELRYLSTDKEKSIYALVEEAIIEYMDKEKKGAKRKA